ncbi:putative calmodulin-binding carboxy-terminal kinesin [Apostichopus japonicus]|uniref:Putative calmodulin-binding carboxy-terminal kinesin n=1 Tax=Stichopus japonicus TaxID=307972 RepID=A0A2G8LGY1_STIJA|nr:putative calmodulin-binding carboxy-terminal kinesin [Apostichopus japonicus]
MGEGRSADVAKLKDDERSSTPVQFLSPKGSSVVSVREAADMKVTDSAGPSSRGSGLRPLSLNARSLLNLLGSITKSQPQTGKQILWHQQMQCCLHKSLKNCRNQSLSKGNPLRNRSPGEGHNGSVPSMRSVISVKEAAEDQRSTGCTPGSSKVLPAASKVDRKTTNASKMQMIQKRSIKGFDSNSSPAPAKQQQAYIPYVMARDTIGKVVDDMKLMKDNHIEIVHKIQDAHKKIEKRLSLSSTFSSSVYGPSTRRRNNYHKTRLVHPDLQIGIHKKMSLAQKNKELMKQKKELLLMNKTEVEKLQKEKEQLMMELTQKMDEDGKTSHEKIKQLQESEKSLEDEKKILEDELASEKNTVKEKEEDIERLRTQLSEGGIAPLVVRSGRDSVGSENAEEKTEVRTSGAAVIVAGISSEERDRIKKEKDEMQDKLIESQKELAIVRVKYSNLEKQYRSVASMAKRDEESIAAQMEDVNKDVEILREEKDKLKEEMATWEKDFKERTGQEPSEEDRPESIKELHIQLEEVDSQESIWKLN